VASKVFTFFPQYPAARRYLVSKTYFLKMAPEINLGQQPIQFVTIKTCNRFGQEPAHGWKWNTRHI